jgi:hypothetical protein
MTTATCTWVDLPPRPGGPDEVVWRSDKIDTRANLIRRWTAAGRTFERLPNGLRRVETHHAPDNDTGAYVTWQTTLTIEWE